MLKIDPAHIQSFDERRNLVIAGNTAATIHFAVEHWIKTAQEAILKRSRFAVALSGGSTPHAIYQALSAPANASRIDWSKVFLFWSDERAVEPSHPDSNYQMAMESGLARLPIPPEQIHRMKAEEHIEENARRYEKLIRETLGPPLFDLVMLGVGEDGHTASLFPHTAALDVQNHLAAANYVADKKTWRMTLTFACINQSRHTAIYALGSGKQTIVNQVLHAPILSAWPSSRVGTKENKALWILDESAAKALL